MFQLRPEKNGDENAIYHLTQLAFSTMPFSNGAEGGIINQLRADGDLYLSLVIASGLNIIGHVAFSPVEIKETSQGWFGLGPVAIHPDHQRQGHGTRLITAGLETLIDRGALGCVLIGDPLYYSRFGFINYGQVSFPPLPTEYVHWRSFSDLMPKGPITFAPAFSLDGEQPN